MTAKSRDIIGNWYNAIFHKTYFPFCHVLTFFVLLFTDSTGQWKCFGKCRYAYQFAKAGLQWAVIEDKA
jgi:subtilase family serine protease